MRKAEAVGDLWEALEAWDAAVGAFPPGEVDLPPGWERLALVASDLAVAAGKLFGHEPCLVVEGGLNG